MNVKVGCKVRFLNEVGGGQVIKMIDKKTALVKTSDGFEVPALIKELVVVEPAADEVLVRDYSEKNEKQNTPEGKQRFEEPTNLDVDDDISDIEGEDITLELAFVPENHSNLQNCNFDLYLINDSTYRVFYVLSNVIDDYHAPFSTGILQPDTKVLIKKLTPGDISKLIMYNLQAIYYKNIPFKPYQPEFYDIELDPIKLYKRGNFLENDYFDKDAYIISIASTKRELILKHLTDKAISEAIKQKEKPKVKRKKEPVLELEEVDLHIHELVDDWKDLTPGEILKIQLARFETALEGGIKSKSTKRMVFIHGVGNGKLKYEITKLLNSKYPKLRYQDASFKEYGFGATMVFVK
ncbi:Smr/MutS family protein [Tenuifilum thalassicum]|uniref:DUF2027 domain-containing protein n=1 Tax=Tenuifilum thalassicum TaxID=2590900 RepID=A0A7D3XL01_9BACT|nr:DUF2027 domain-containing protein [Tenuifilum thalassicum]QKG79995.1 DUF2027 domain-containing protein [Tenuifilum thalassicum]